MTHLPTIHEALTASSAARFWRSDGRYVPSHLLESVLASDGHDCLVVESRGMAIGLVEVFDVSSVDRHAQLGRLARHR